MVCLDFPPLLALLRLTGSCVPPVGCIKAASTVLRMPPSLAMEPCRHSVPSSESEEGKEGGSKKSESSMQHNLIDVLLHLTR